MDTLLPDGWPRPAGYANGVVASGRIVFVAGQVGWDPVAGVVRTSDFGEQTRRALENVLAVLRAGGADATDIVRMTWFITDLEAYRASRRQIGAAWRELFGRHFPAMSVIGVSALLEEGAMIEIEATAVIA